jgi:hypothetical protein
MSIVKNQYGTIDLPATVEALEKRIAALEQANQPAETPAPKSEGKKDTK